VPTDAAPGIITLTTDFGLIDPYVAAMKGVILGINPRANVIDVSHDIRPQRVLQAAFITQSAWQYFPPAAVHVAVVDPGVGTARRSIALETPSGHFVGPDNGVLSAALPKGARPAIGPEAVCLPEGYTAVEITNRRYMRQPVSATFQGRDVFAPAAAHLSLGVSLGELGRRVDSLIALPPLRAHRNEAGELEGRVVHIDRFGNVITDIRGEDLPRDAFEVEIGGQRVRGLVRTYGDAVSLSMLIGSGGYLEVALPSGNAAQRLGVGIGETALLRPA
jgi:S-adenosyl-L-methionine hydrolase (adenosine-forming)